MVRYSWMDGWKDELQGFSLIMYMWIRKVSYCISEVPIIHLQ